MAKQKRKRIKVTKVYSYRSNTSSKNNLLGHRKLVEVIKHASN